MEIFDQKAIKVLMQKRGQDPCISLYLPTVKKGEVEQNPIMFKNLLSKAEEQLRKRDLRTPDIKKLLEPAYQLINESIFWNNQSEGLALFISPDFIKYYRLPIRFDKLAVVTNSFHLKPIIPALVEDGQFYVLALSQKDARLLRGTRDVVEEMDLSDVIKRFEEKFGEELPEQHLQFHTRASITGRAKSRAAVYFGHGGDISNIKKEKIMRYFRFLDKEIHSMLYEEGSPLILACVDYLSPLFRKTNNYPYLLEEEIRGNPEKISKEELHKRAWDIINPYFEKKKEEKKAYYNQLKGTGKTSNDIREVLPASFQGRIETLFVPLGVQLWGKYSLENENLELKKENPAMNDEDLYDLAAAQTYLNKGTVYAIKKEDMPGDDMLAAMYRF